MCRIPVSLVAIVAITAGAAASAQQSRVDRAFTAAGESCDQVNWSPEALSRYPNIASACQEVMERDGRYYVKFSGEVRRVADRGRSITVDFKGGDQLELTPPENMSLYINGRPRQPSALRRGDELTFYVPQDQLAADPAKAVQVVGVTVIPLTSMRVAQAQPPAEETGSAGAELPQTASPLPLIGLGGLILVAAGGFVTLRRRWRG